VLSLDVLLDRHVARDRAVRAEVPGFGDIIAPSHARSGRQYAVLPDEVIARWP
jgi:hypothetical protein